MGQDSMDASFFGIPIELRCRIYEVILFLPTRDHLSLLSVCRQTYDEASEYLFHRPVTFNSQHVLSSFVQQRNAQSLARVRDAALRLEDARVEDHLPVLAQLAAGTLPFSSIEHPLHQEYLKLRKNIDHFGAMERFALLQPLPGRPIAPPDLVEETFKLVAKRWPGLLSLTLMIDTTSLEPLTRLENLRSLHFTGFSLSEPSQMAKVLRDLPYLKRLSISGPPAPRRPWQTKGAGWGRQRFQSITGPILAVMKPLRSFSVMETPNAGRNEPKFINPENLTAIRDQHANHLQHLRISAPMVLDQVTIRAIRRVFEKTVSLESVDMGWLGIDIVYDVIDRLPSSIGDITLVVGEVAQLEASVGQLRHSLERLSQLRFLQLQISEDSDGQLARTRISAVVSVLAENAKWKVSWSIWQDDPLAAERSRSVIVSDTPALAEPR